MITKVPYSYLLLTGMLFFMTSCGKDAGFGGDTTLKIYAAHHGKPIYSQANYRDSVFIKFDANESPGPDASDYDYTGVGNVGESFVTVEGLKQGQYYIFMAAFDTAINERVIAGIPYEIVEDGLKEVTVPVTEGD